MVELLQFGHTMVIVGAFVAVGFVPLSLKLLLIVPAVLIILLNGLAVGLWLGPTVARFRDVGPFVDVDPAGDDVLHAGLLARRRDPSRQPRHLGRRGTRSPTCWSCSAIPCSASSRPR